MVWPLTPASLHTVAQNSKIEVLITTLIMSSPTATTPAVPECTTAIPDSNGYVPPSSCNANYGFYPSWEWNLAFAIFFGLTTLAHVVQMFVYRKVRSSSILVM